MSEDDRSDASRDDPVRDYYAEKKRRYLARLREGGTVMTTGTPHDWQDAERYGREAAEEDEDGA